MKNLKIELPETFQSETSTRHNTNIMVNRLEHTLCELQTVVLASASLSTSLIPLFKIFFNPFFISSHCIGDHKKEH